MKKLTALVLAVASCAFGQQTVQPQSTMTGSGTPSAGFCQGPQNVGWSYDQLGNPSNGGGSGSHYICEQTGASGPGGTIGGFGWVSVQLQSGAGTTGTISVANGKAAVISNSLTFAGTDSTTFTTPTTSATAARTDAAQTFTGVQTFSSAPVIATITNTGTETLPSTTGGLPILIACGNTTTGTGTCANTAVGATSKVYFGNATLASNAQTITISPGFTSSSTFQCLGNDQTTRANAVQVIPASATTFTITNTTGASDVIQWACFGY